MKLLLTRPPPILEVPPSTVECLLSRSFAQPSNTRFPTALISSRNRSHTEQYLVLINWSQLRSDLDAARPQSSCLESGLELDPLLLLKIWKGLKGKHTGPDLGQYNMILMARTFGSLPIGVATILLGVATAVLLFVLALTAPSAHEVLHALPLVAGIVQSFACCVRVTLMFLKYRHDKKMSSQPLVEQSARSYAFLLTLRILLSLASAVVVGSALGWAEANLTTKELLIAGISASAFMTVTWVVWGTSILADVLYYISLIWVHRNSLKVSEHRFSIEDAPREMIQPSRPATATTVQSNPFHEQFLSSPPSLIASDGTASLRSSLSTLPRPSSSKRGILIRQNSYTRYSGRSSWDSPSGRPSQDEAFDSWYVFLNS